MCVRGLFRAVKQIKGGILASAVRRSRLLADEYLILVLPVLLSLLRSPLSKQFGTSQEVANGSCKRMCADNSRGTSKNILIESEILVVVRDK